MHWQITLTAHWPHDRLAIGWELLHASEEVPWTTVQLFLGVLTLRLDVVDAREE